MRLPTFRVSVVSSVPPFDGYDDLNERRARRGKKVLGRYAEKHYSDAVDQNDVEMVASDLISDILHFAHTAGVSPAALLERVGRSFEGDFEDEPAEFRVVGSVPLADAVAASFDEGRVKGLDARD